MLSSSPPSSYSSSSFSSLIRLISSYLFLSFTFLFSSSSFFFSFSSFPFFSSFFSFLLFSFSFRLLLFLLFFLLLFHLPYFSSSSLFSSSLPLFSLLLPSLSSLLSLLSFFSSYLSSSSLFRSCGAATVIGWCWRNLSLTGLRQLLCGASYLQSCLNLKSFIKAHRLLHSRYLQWNLLKSDHWPHKTQLVLVTTSQQPH